MILALLVGLARAGDDLYALGLDASTRPQAIDGYRAHLATAPGDIEARLALAQFLSWTPGRVGEAVDVYREAVAAAPGDRRARLGLARTLAWAGRNAEARERLDALIADDPRDGEALLVRAQLARWTGDRATARALLARTGAAFPGDARVRAEEARLLLDSGRAGAARAAAREALAAAPGMYEAEEAVAAVRDATRTSARARVSFSEEDGALRRWSLGARGAFFPAPDTRVRVEPAVTRFEDDAGAVDRVSLGGEVRQGGLPHGLYGAAHYGAHLSADVPTTHAFGAEVGAVRPGDVPIEARLGARQRVLADLPVAVGWGGATMAAIREGRVTREVTLAVAGAPWRGAYAYGDGTLGWIDDGNATRALAAGVGQDVLRLGDGAPRHALVVKYDVYVLAMDAVSSAYFSPASMVVHTPGVDWRFHPRDGASLGVEGGVPMQGDRYGWLVGASGTLEARGFALEARVRAFDDTVYRVVAVVVGVGGEF